MTESAIDLAETEAEVEKVFELARDLQLKLDQVQNVNTSQ